MRNLKFNVSGQVLERDETCDFKGLVSGSKNYLTAEFNFNSEWDGYKKIAIFVNGDNEYPTPLIGDKCKINNDALTSRSFRVYIIGRKGTEQINTTSIKVRQVLK